MNKNEHICVICGEVNPIDEMTVLAELRGITGRDLGYVCQKCTNHIDNIKYFERIDEVADYES